MFIKRLLISIKCFLFYKQLYKTRVKNYKEIINKTRAFNLTELYYL